MQFLRNILTILQKNEKRKVLQLILLDVFVSILDILFLVLLLFIINFYTQVARPVYPASPYLDIWYRHPLLLIGIFTVLFALKNWFALFIIKKQYYFIYQVASRISAQKLEDYFEGSYSDYVNIDSSVHLRHIHYDSLDFADFVLRGCQQVLSQCVLIIITFIPILIFKPVLFSLLLLVLIPPFFLLFFIIKRRLDSIRDLMKTIHGKVFQYVKEAISGFIESHIYQGKKFFSERYANARAEQASYRSEQQIMQTFPPRVIEVFAVAGLFILAAINLYVNGNAVSVITIGAFMAAAYKIIPGIVKILNSVSQIKAYSFTVTNLFPAHRLGSNDFDDQPISSVEFKNIFFNYNPEKLLTDVSFSMERGDFVGIIGRSGQGKTTFLNLAIGFLTPHSGTILINGKSEALALRRFRNKISYVKQQPFFINDSIAFNISLKEAYDKERLEKVMAITGVTDMVSRHGESGAGMMITENGKNFSGGQRQRLAFARALYKNADILLLDEPFSELDNVSERYLMEVLKKMAEEGQMILLVTHNKENLFFCSKIIDLDKG